MLYCNKETSAQLSFRANSGRIHYAYLLIGERITKTEKQIRIINKNINFLLTYHLYNAFYKQSIHLETHVHKHAYSYILKGNAYMTRRLFW